MLNLLFDVDNLSNHSISIINRNLMKYFKQSEGINIVNKKHSDIHIELRHTYPPNFRLSTAKILVFIIPWEFSKVPTEWILNLKFLGSTPKHLIVPSHFTKNIFINCGLNESMIHVIPNGIDFSVFFPKPHLQPSTFKQFIFIGNNSPRKGLDCLLEAWKQADLQSSQLIIKTTSFIYGHDPIYSSISNTYKNVKVIDKELSENELSDLIASSHIIVSPYRGESYGMCIAEAMACDVFPLVTKNGATDDYIVNEHCKIPSIKVKSNIFSLGAGKPGDSFSPMNSHNFHFEPITSSLVSQLKFLDSSSNLPLFCSNNLLSWKDVSFKYILLFYIICHHVNIS